MNFSLSAQQTAFFQKNGSLELEALFTPEECAKILSSIKKAAASRHCDNKTISDQIRCGRDLWRDENSLKTLLLSRSLSSIASSLSPKQPLRLGFDQWFPENYTLAQPTKLKDLFSIQGVAFIFFIQLEHPIEIPKQTSPIGILPFPKGQGNILIVNPNLLINWPAGSPLYSAAYCHSNALYIHNPKDPACNELKKLGYGFGDPLSNATHPLIAH